MANGVSLNDQDADEVDAFLNSALTILDPLDVISLLEGLSSSDNAKASVSTDQHDQ